MPAGLPTKKYVKVMGSFLFSMFIGSQLVHWQFSPLLDMKDRIEEEKVLYRKEFDIFKERKLQELFEEDKKKKQKENTGS